MPVMIRLNRLSPSATRNTSITECVPEPVIPQVDDHVIPHRDDVRGVVGAVLVAHRLLPLQRADGSLMARRSFDVVDVTEMVVHWHAGRSQSEIAASLGVDRKTVKKYLAPALEAGIVPGDAPRTQEQWAAQCGRGGRDWSTRGCGRPPGR
jgi:hypothetical protein